LMNMGCRPNKRRKSDGLYVAASPSLQNRLCCGRYGRAAYFREHPLIRLPVDIIKAIYQDELMNITLTQRATRIIIIP